MSTTTLANASRSASGRRCHRSLASCNASNCSLAERASRIAELFERFVTSRLRRALRGRLEVRSEPPVHLAHGGQVRMKPDLEFRRRGATTYVGDIKYKLTADARARNADYYQLLAYTTAMDLPEGLLIYCLADGGRPERSVTVRQAGKVLHTRAVDLTGAPPAVSAELEALADWIWSRRASGVPARAGGSILGDAGALP